MIKATFLERIWLDAIYINMYDRSYKFDGRADAARDLQRKEESGSMYHLYFSPGACSVAPHIVLEEIGQPYTTELVRVDISSKAENITQADYLKINPKGRVPALKIGDHILTEAPAILTYLARKHPEADLLPRDP